MSSERPVTVYGAIAANVVRRVSKLAAGIISGSSAMLSEAIHSVVDTGNELLLLLGIHRSTKPADELHPFGWGKELYFWSLIVAILLFGLGGGMSIYEGISHLCHPAVIRDPTWNYEGSCTLSPPGHEAGNIAGIGSTAAEGDTCRGETDHHGCCGFCWASCSHWSCKWLAFSCGSLPVRPPLNNRLRSIMK
jgi:hypothetical protein